jgi:hypothetical protein
MNNDQKVEFSEWDVEVAKRIACAVVSYQAGMPYETLWQQHTDQKEDIGTFWLSIAKHIREDFPHRPK